jgi:hypothetical protein
MAKGDTVELKSGDEIELSFQLAMKLAEIKKRRDAALLTHIRIEINTELSKSPAEGGDVKITALDSDVTGDPNVHQILPITQDDQKFTRLYRVGPISMFLKELPPQPLFVTVDARICDAQGKFDPETSLPRDRLLLRLHVKP